MPVIRILQSGFTSFSGQMGDVEFENGVSKENVAKSEARRLASFMRVEEVDTGRNPSHTQDLVESKAKPASEAPKSKPLEQPVAEPKPKIVEVEKVFDYSIKDLETIADEKGIEGLREFASSYDVRGGSIKQIIDSLMAVKSESQKAN